ncbi:protein serine/threonine phosphatase [Chthoniobacter flavus Ellin428]|uniref:Protein serine/threonine phosphatase n=1 Tax=Chthoniobacter flavus Ellin428 TaxID=497964 RepID=B4D8F5_9BACT|nr:protein phosphatase 2C domain-containing protein [Chthoniobacter flavus]EDY17348.1 protein serine/threonine phosphatase [Chthoniobacter flavus Ellin428]TCO90083.1 protein phosphatase [Chthoniobacter flavus]
MRPEIDFAGRQVHGSRETQDDYYGFCPLSADTDGLDGLLLVLADGMGGYKGGGTASRIVVESFIEHFCFSRGTLRERMLGSLHASRRSLLEEIARHDESFGHMGSTLVAVVRSPQGLHWVSVGDSGLYLFRDGVVQRVNADHSMAPLLADQVARGEMTAEEAAHHPDRHALRSAIAARPLFEFELRDQPFELQRGDIVYAATDGLASLTDEEVAERMQTNARESAEHIATALLIAINELGRKRQDNTTVAVIRNE